jgi:hypothetical protein
MTIQHGIKVIAFSSLNISLFEYWPLLLGIGLATLAGNLVGAKLLARVPEDKFTVILKLATHRTGIAPGLARPNQFGFPLNRDVNQGNTHHTEMRFHSSSFSGENACPAKPY